MYHAFRLIKGDDLNKKINEYAMQHQLKSAIVLSGVGCVDQMCIRLADGESVLTRIEPFEIVSITGTISLDGSHIHVSFSDVDGTTIGGHLMDGCLINTTCEVVIVELEGFTFTRTFDKNTGYDELVIHHTED